MRPNIKEIGPGNGPRPKYNKQVSVKWVQKQRGDNHYPEVRPVDSDALGTTERKIYRTTLEGIDAIPLDTYRRIIRGLIDPEEVTTDLLVRHLLTDIEEVAKAIFEGYVQGAREMAHLIRQAMNKELRRLGSDLQLVGIAATSKAKITGMYEPWDWDDPTIPAVSLFDQQPDNMSGKVYARIRANDIFSSVTDDVNANIREIVAEGFTAEQTFRTGRSVTGLTPQQTARRLFEVLEASAAIPITGLDYAEYVAPHTNGLFPRWAKAVDRSMNTYAQSLAQRGINDREIKERTSKHGERYGNKLRRARARMIARTEIAFAQNRGMMDTLWQAQDQGIMGQSALKEWVTGPFDVCDLCTPMGGKKQYLRGQFTLPNGRMLDYPPAHPNCRCFILPVPELIDAPQRFGSNTLDDPYRYQFPDGFVISTSAGFDLPALV